MAEITEERLRRAFEVVKNNPWHAHNTFFAHRHPTEPAIFHEELVADFWSNDRYSQVLAFRGGAKSTYGEEDIVLAAALPVFRNILIIGASETRAAERLASISYEMETNELIAEMFGQLKGSVWTQTKLVTRANVCIQAMGRDQDIRGIKHLEWRPDFVFVDDFEDKDNVQTPEGRIKTLRWFLAELLPACAPHRKVRVRATPMDVESVPMRLQNEAKWPTRTFPIEIAGENGERVPTWPSLFSLDWIDSEKKTYMSLGEMQVWNREYMCQAVSDSDRVFSREMMRVRPRTRTWEAVYAMYDPARTTRQTSATTGMVAWSWVQNRLVIWKSQGKRWQPDEIIADIFATADEFDPVWIGVEEDGLNEWLLQPIRQEQTRRGTVIPVKPLRAPRGKLDFIRGLQPFFKAGEVEFATPQPELEAQLLSFPTGDIDIPNALAYALWMRPAAPIYDGFSLAHVAEVVAVERHRPVWLAFNATKAMATAALVQYGNGRLGIIADFAAEGDPAETAPLIVREASLLARTQVTATCGPAHYDRYLNVGLAQALQHIPLTVERGTDPAKGRDVLRQEFATMRRDLPTVRIGRGARYTLNALAGGYSRQITRQGVLTQEAEPGIYRLMMEGIESCLGATAAEANVDENVIWSYTASGQRYRRYATAQDRRA